MITLKQIDAALGLLGQKRATLAENIGIKATTFNAYFTGKNQISTDTLNDVESYFTSRGLEFTDFNGVREKPTGNMILKGKSGFRELYDMLYEAAKTVRPDGEKVEILLYNGVSKLVMDALGVEAVEAQKQRMIKIESNFRYRVIVEEDDDTFFGSSYCEYKWLPKEHFNDSTIFVFGSYFAVVDFDNDIEITVINNQKTADSTKLMFEQVWNGIAIEPNE